jgi:tRNA G26 N,N-dimethylase Trm1
MVRFHYCHAIQTTNGELDMEMEKDNLNRNCYRTMEPSWGGDMDDAEMVVNMDGRAKEELTHIASVEANNSLDRTRFS